MSFKRKLIQTAISNFTKITLQQISTATNTVLSKPTLIGMCITLRCNLKCKHCDIPLNSDRSEELSSEQWKKILRQLRKWLGTATLRWAGGEPFIRHDILELIKYSTELGMLNNIVTNGQLIDRELAERIVDAGTFCVSISIDGMHKGHDFVRGEGAFAKAVAAAHFLNEARRDKKSGMRIMVNSTIMQTNLDEIIDLVDWVEREGLDGVNIAALIETLGRYANPDPKWFQSSPLWVRDLEKLDEVIDALIERSGPKLVVKNPASHLKSFKEYYRDPTVPKPGDFTCHVGHDNFWIGSRGIICMCPYIPSPIVGNIIESRPERIWKSPQAAASRKTIAACRKNCPSPCLYKRDLKENFELFLKLFKQT
ncbi:MAG: radical SAM protein [Planctomycetota bacterium]|jgi:MoaA/NifB/PqqE/SkfB family radical SAM enzyme